MNTCLFVCLFLCDKEKNMNTLFWVKVNFYSVTDPTKKVLDVVLNRLNAIKIQFFCGLESRVTHRAESRNLPTA